MVFPNARGTRLSPDGVQYRLGRHRTAASKVCPSLTHKRVTVHVLRHTMALDLLQAGVDRSVIALWLGHESVETTQIYTHVLNRGGLGVKSPADRLSDRGYVRAPHILEARACGARRDDRGGQDLAEAGRVPAAVNTCERPHISTPFSRLAGAGRISVPHNHPLGRSRGSVRIGCRSAIWDNRARSCMTAMAVAGDVDK